MDAATPQPEKMSLYQLLESKYSDEHSILLYEVRDSTGFDSSRSADAMAISLYRTRGREITGFEVKHSRADWLRELKQPKKAEEIGKFCDFFFLLTPDESVAKIEELPLPWGWMVPRSSRFKVMKKPERMPAAPLDRQMLCSLLYTLRAKCFIDIEKQIDEAVEKRTGERHSSSIHRMNRAETELKDLREIVRKFEHASGINIKGWNPEHPEKIGRVVKQIMENEDMVKKYERELKYVVDSARRLIERIEEENTLVKAGVADLSTVMD